MEGQRGRKEEVGETKKKRLKSEVTAVSRERDTFSKTVSELDKKNGQL